MSVDEQIIGNECFTIWNQYYQTKLNDLGIILFIEDNVFETLSFEKKDKLSDDIKICYIFEYQSNENRAFRFWGDTRCI